MGETTVRAQYQYTGVRVKTWKLGGVLKAVSFFQLSLLIGRKWYFNFGDHYFFCHT